MIFRHEIVSDDSENGDTSESEDLDIDALFKRKPLINKRKKLKRKSKHANLLALKFLKPADYLGLKQVSKSLKSVAEVTNIDNDEEDIQINLIDRNEKAKNLFKSMLEVDIALKEEKTVTKLRNDTVLKARELLEKITAEKNSLLHIPNKFEDIISGNSKLSSNSSFPRKSATIKSTAERLLEKENVSLRFLQQIKGDERSICSSSLPSSEESRNEKDGFPLQFRLKGLANGLVVSVAKQKSFLEVKKKLELRYNVVAKEIKLRYDGDLVEDNDSPESLDMEPEDLIDVEVR